MRARRAPPRRIVMLGTDRASRGGIAAVVRAYADGGLFARWPLTYLATHRDGGALGKLAQAAASWWRLLAMLAGGRVALLHLHLASRASFWRKLMFYLPARLARVPVVVHLHGGGFQAFYAGSGAPTRALVRQMLGGASRVLVLSASWQAWLLGVCPRARVTVLPNPVALAPRPAAGGGQLLFLGKLCAAKGCYDLLAALALLAPAWPALRLVLAGDGEPAALAARAQALGLAARVELPGYVDAAARERLLDGAVACVLPSYLEGLPMCLLEAMAAGVPVVASRVGGIPDLVDDGVDGLLVEAGDVAALARALERLLAQPALQRAMGAAGRAKVARAYAPGPVLAQLELVYRQSCAIDSGLIY